MGNLDLLHLALDAVMSLVHDEDGKNAGEDDEATRNHHPAFALAAALGGARGCDPALSAVVALRQHLISKGVVDKTAKGEAVPEELKRGDGCVPDDD